MMDLHEMLNDLMMRVVRIEAFMAKVQPGWQTYEKPPHEMYPADPMQEPMTPMTTTEGEPATPPADDAA